MYVVVMYPCSSLVFPPVFCVVEKQNEMDRYVERDRKADRSNEEKRGKYTEVNRGRIDLNTFDCCELDFNYHYGAGSLLLL